MRQIEGLGVGQLAKTGSKLSRRYGKNRAFQEFQLQHEPAFLTQHTHQAILLIRCVSDYVSTKLSTPFSPFCFPSPPSFPLRTKAVGGSFNQLNYQHVDSPTVCVCVCMCVCVCVCPPFSPLGDGVNRCVVNIKHWAFLQRQGNYRLCSLLLADVHGNRNY